MASDVQRKLTTILAADAAGYSREMAADEVRALAALRAARSVFAKLIERHHGRIANTAGDGLIAEFPSTVEAVQCAVEVQRELGDSPSDGMRFRIGVHLGDVLVDGNDLLGEGVNLAARLQTMAEPGGVLISQQVYDQVQRKLSVGFEYMGEKRPKNFAEDVAVYRVSGDAAGESRPREQRAARAPRPAAAARPDLRARTIRRAALLGAIWAMLFISDIATGPPLWTHWLALAFALWLGWSAAPLVANGRALSMLRAGVLIAALGLINLFTWSGYAWFLWPAGAIVLWVLVRRLFARQS